MEYSNKIILLTLYCILFFVLSIISIFYAAILKGENYLDNKSFAFISNTSKINKSYSKYNHQEINLPSQNLSNLSKQNVQDPSQSLSTRLNKSKHSSNQNKGSFSLDKPFMSRSHYDRYKGSNVIDYTGCIKGQSYSTDDKLPNDSEHFDISLLMSGSFNRLFLLPIIAKRWSGPIVFVIHLKQENLTVFESFLHQENHKLLCSSRITLLVYISQPNCFFYSNYPINILRNISIRHCRTSHYLLLDMDMLISEKAYETLIKLPASITTPYKNAFVLPAFFSSNWFLPNLPLQQQMESNSIMSKIPYSLQELCQCKKKRLCSEKKRNLFTHYYVIKPWIDDLLHNTWQQYYNYSCWPNRYQEPYMLVKRDDNVTVFNEILINYGHNKITYIENLRFHEYQFYLLGGVFAFDIPHSPSQFQKKHVKQVTTENWYAKTNYLSVLYKESLSRSHVMTLCDNSNPY